ncbi:MAG: hypothetical protein ACLR2O_13875 [Coprococcus sp.]
MDQRKKSSEVICEQAVQIIQDRYAQQDLSVMIISERDRGVAELSQQSDKKDDRQFNG